MKVHWRRLFSSKTADLKTFLAAVTLKEVPNGSGNSSSRPHTSHSVTSTSHSHNDAFTFKKRAQLSFLAVEVTERVFQEEIKAV